jgi:hypothetical protein
VTVSTLNEENDRTIWHVLPHPAGWKLKRRNGERATRVTEKQGEAIKYGIKLAQNNQPSQLVIHDRNGRIRDERTYGQDPEDIPG